MPVADFPGRRNWGYDGVLPFAPDCVLRHAGRPEAPGRRGARARPDGAARRRLQPLRPRRQLPARYAPPFFTERHQTPWGAAINFDGAQPRRCASSSSTTRSTGSRSFTSTACASTRCTRSATTARRIFSTSSRSACARGPGRDAARASGAGERRNERALSRGPRAPLLRRAVERRRAPRAARAARPASATATTPTTRDDPLQPPRARARRRLRLPGRALGVSRRHGRAASQRRICRRPPSCRSCRTTTRSATARSASGSAALARRASAAAIAAVHAARAAGAAALHGRGVRRRHAVPVSSATSAASLAAR